MRLPSVYPSLLNLGDGGTSPGPRGTPFWANHPHRCLKGNTGAAEIKGRHWLRMWSFSSWCEARLIKRMPMWENVAVPAVDLTRVTVA